MNHDLFEYNKHYNNIRLVLEPSGERDDNCPRVYTFGNVGPGIPERVYHHRHLTLATLHQGYVAESLLKWLEKNEAKILAVNEGYEGAAWNGHNFVGSWTEEAIESASLFQDELAEAIGYGEVARYWDAEDYLYGDKAGVIDDALLDNDVTKAAEREVEQARAQGCYLDLNETKEVLRSWITSQ